MQRNYNRPKFQKICNKCNREFRTYRHNHKLCLFCHFNGLNQSDQSSKASILPDLTLALATQQKTTYNSVIVNVSCTICRKNFIPVRSGYIGPCTDCIEFGIKFISNKLNPEQIYPSYYIEAAYEIKRTQNDHNCQHHNKMSLNDSEHIIVIFQAPRFFTRDDYSNSDMVIGNKLSYFWKYKDDTINCKCNISYNFINAYLRNYMTAKEQLFDSKS